MSFLSFNCWFKRNVNCMACAPVSVSRFIIIVNSMLIKFSSGRETKDTLCYTQLSRLSIPVVYTKDGKLVQVTFILENSLYS